MPPDATLKPAPNPGQALMNTSPVLGTFAFAAAATAVALGWRSLAPGPTVSSTRGEVPGLSTSPPRTPFPRSSRSEPSSRPSARRCLYQVPIRQADALRARLPAGSPGGDAERTSITGLVQEFEERIREFQGTGEEPLLVRGLLLLLASDGAYERWLEVYLDFLYRRPTEELVGRLAREALTAGRATGRLAEVAPACATSWTFRWNSRANAKLQGGARQRHPGGSPTGKRSG